MTDVAARPGWGGWGDRWLGDQVGEDGVTVGWVINLGRMG